jgi:hypothetical protein
MEPVHVPEQALHEFPVPLESYRDPRSPAIEEQKLQYLGEHDTVGGR